MSCLCHCRYHQYQHTQTYTNALTHYNTPHKYTDIHTHTHTHTHRHTQTHTDTHTHTHTQTGTHTCGCFFDQLGVPHHTLLDQLHHGLHISRVRTLKGLGACLGCHGCRTYGLRSTMTEGSSATRLIGRDTPLVLTVVRYLNQKGVWLHMNGHGYT